MTILTTIRDLGGFALACSGSFYGSRTAQRSVLIRGREVRELAGFPLKGVSLAHFVDFVDFILLWSVSDKRVLILIALSWVARY
jgi:hypothetical protein